MNKKQKQAMKLGKQLLEQNKKQICVSCNGSGYYDTKGSPKCSSCNGTGYKQKEFSEEGLTTQMHFSEASEEDIKQDLIEARKGKIPRLSLRDIGELKGE